MKVKKWFPLVIDVDDLGGSNANHNLFRIAMKKDLQFYDAILAQELYEWWYLRKQGMVFTLPFIAWFVHIVMTYGWVVELPILGFGMLAAHVLGPRIVSPIHETMEIRGQTIELAHVMKHRPDVDPEEYLRRTVINLSFYDFLDHLSNEELERRVREYLPTALKKV